MTFDDPEKTEATMSAAATIGDPADHRYGYAPQMMFAATRAFAERPAREPSTATAPNAAPRPARGLIRRLAALFGASAS